MRDARETRYAPEETVNHSGGMRYLIQFLIPALIFLGVVYIVTKRRRQTQGEDDDSNSTFLVILVVGAVVAVALLFATQAYLDI